MNKRQQSMLLFNSIKLTEEKIRLMNDNWEYFRNDDAFSRDKSLLGKKVINESIASQKFSPEKEFQITEWLNEYPEKGFNTFKDMLESYKKYTKTFRDAAIIGYAIKKVVPPAPFVGRQGDDKKMQEEKISDEENNLDNVDPPILSHKTKKESFLKKALHSKWLCYGSLIVFGAGALTCFGEYLSSKQFLKGNSLIGESISAGIAVIGFFGFIVYIVYKIACYRHKTEMVNNDFTDNNNNKGQNNPTCSISQ